MQLMIYLAAALSVPEAPPAALPPQISVVLLSKEKERQPAALFSYRRRLFELLVTLHDLRAIRYEVSDLDPKRFDECMQQQDEGDWQEDQAREGRNGCIGKLLPTTENGVPVIAMVVEDMRWRSAAQGLTCITPGAGAIERTFVHLKDAFHRYEHVRQGVRTSVQNCIAKVSDAPGGGS